MERMTIDELLAEMDKTIGEQMSELREREEKDFQRWQVKVWRKELARCQKAFDKLNAKTSTLIKDETRARQRLENHLNNIAVSRTELSDAEYNLEKALEDGYVACD